MVTKNRGKRKRIRGNLRSKENARVKKRLAPLGRVRTRPRRVRTRVNRKNSRDFDFQYEYKLSVRV